MKHSYEKQIVKAWKNSKAAAERRYIFKKVKKAYASLCEAENAIASIQKPTYENVFLTDTLPSILKNMEELVEVEKND